MNSFIALACLLTFVGLSHAVAIGYGYGAPLAISAPIIKTAAIAPLATPAILKTVPISTLASGYGLGYRSYGLGGYGLGYGLGGYGLGLKHYGLGYGGYGGYGLSHGYGLGLGLGYGKRYGGWGWGKY